MANKIRIIRQIISVFMIFAMVMAVYGCEGGLKSLTNQELAAKSDECVQGNPTAPGKVTACENIKKECARRRKEGNFAC